jgi:asparagine synthase (glutamine-hydrolysing)
MCGIAVILQRTDAARQPDIAGLARMAAALGHRGPDDSGVVAIGRCGLAHTRAPTIDAEGGRQPMTTNDLGLVISYDGDVVNHIELRKTLASLGRRFRTKSDTEVVLQAYAEWGEDAFARFNGQFAVAIWDARRERLVLARDHLGARPIHTCEHAGRVYVASEVKAIFAADRTIRRALDPDFARDLEHALETNALGRTAFAGIDELRPGHVRSYDRQGVREHAFWSPCEPHAFEGTIDDATEAVSEALTRATSVRMVRADVPVGVHLSADLDSLLVAALARRATSARFATFSLRYEEDDVDDGPGSETAFLRGVARELETEHHEVVVSRDDIARVFPDAVAHSERPISGTAPAAFMLLSRVVRDAGIRIILTATGANQVFAGGGGHPSRLDDAERMWMASSVTGRFPFLDGNVVALASSLPRSYERILDRVASGVLPKQLMPSTSSSVCRLDAIAFFSARRPSWIADVLDDRAIARAGVFDPAVVRRLAARCRIAEVDRISARDRRAFIRVLSTQLLHRKLVEEVPETRLAIVARRAVLPIREVRS